MTDTLTEMLLKITVVTACYNEEENVKDLFLRVQTLFKEKLPEYTYEHLFIDNNSSDSTVAILRELALTHPHLKVIVNARNFGHIRSPIYALMQASGDAVISLVADFQDPPEMIVDFIRHWEKGNLVVIGTKTEADESPLMYGIRTFYYNLVAKLSDVELHKNTTGFGLYDRKFIEALRKINDPYPYFRGLISEIGFKALLIPYRQPRRRRGITKNNFYTLYDMALLGITNHSKVPLRLATMLGFLMSAISLCIAFGYLVMKLLFWQQFLIGTAPILIGLFFFSSVQLFFIGILGEYIGSIHTQVQKRPLVIEKERINL